MNIHSQEAGQPNSLNQKNIRYDALGLEVVFANNSILWSWPAVFELES